MDSYQDYQEAQTRIKELEKVYVLDEVLQAELDDLLIKVERFNEIITNFE